MRTAALDRWPWPTGPGGRALATADCSIGATPTLDIGCGPGRLTGLLAERGVPVLGVDIAPEAVRLCRSRGGIALVRDVFARVPGEGRWRHLLLADGTWGPTPSPRSPRRRA